jgi:hypothetical protein
MPLPLYRKQDIQPMLDEFGVPVTIGGVTAKCIINDSDEEIASGANALLIGRAIIARADRDAFPAAAQGVAATADYPAAGTTYEVVSVRRDINTVSITLAKV